MTRKAIAVKKKPARERTRSKGPSKATVGSAADKRDDAASLEQSLKEAFARALSRPLTAEERLAQQYEGRIRGIKSALDRYAEFLHGESPEIRSIAHDLIDDVCAVIDGQGRKQRLRFELMKSLETACLYLKPEDPDDAAVKRFIRTLDVELQSISREDATTAIAVWRDDRPRPKGLPSKWKFLAELTERLELGEIKHDSLERDWRNWVKDNGRLRDVLDERKSIRERLAITD